VQEEKAGKYGVIHVLMDGIRFCRKESGFAGRNQVLLAVL
jgi:hypothetical protein